MTIRTAVIGAGAIGGTLGGFMTKNGENVLLIDEWKDHVDTMKKHGLRLDGITGESIVQVNAIHTDEIPNISGTFDLIVISVKFKSDSLVLISPKIITTKPAFISAKILSGFRLPISTKIKTTKSPGVSTKILITNR